MTCLSYIKTKVGVLFDYSANVENLREQIEDLSDVRISLENRIEEDENIGGTVRVDPIVELWLERVSTLEEMASRIMEQEDRETERRCLMGLFPNLWACYLTSKSAKRLAEEAVELREYEKRFDRVPVIVDYSKCLGFQPIREFEEFESRASVTKQIMAALKDPSVSMVGLYGMGGIGKTTLAEMIAEQLYLDGTFRFVVMASVSSAPDLKRTQQDIADALKIKLDAETEEGRAFQLREGLEEREKLLIILDDVWERIELKEVGIPFGSDRQNIDSPKILITSRSAQVTWEMECRHNFQLDTLSPPDSWNFFKRWVGSVDPSYLSVAAAIVDRCEGIPVLIATVARALRHGCLSIWEDALMQLERFDGYDFDEYAYKRIEVSYKFLSSDEIKKVFLLCGQLMCADGISIQDLLKYTVGLGLFKWRRNLSQVRNRLHMHLSDLKGSCLLRDGNREGTVRMLDVVRKLAAHIACRDHRMFSVYECELEEWPSQDELQHFTSISLCYCTNLPPQLPAPFDNQFLESFLLLRKDEDDPSALKIPDNFFRGLKGLKVASLRRMSLSPLPPSLKCLAMIRTLCLDFCELGGGIDIIGELPMLEVLSLRGSTIVYLPGQIRNLTRLMLLDLCDCSELKGIAKGVLSELTLLEDLYMKNSFNLWEEEVEEGGGSGASLGELRDLRKLCRLDIHIPDANKLPRDLVLGDRLENFRILIGEGWEWGDDDDDYSTILKLQLDAGHDIELNKGVNSLMKRAQVLYLSGLDILDMNSCVVSPDLKFLFLEHMQNVERSFHGPKFIRLESIKVEGCDRLKDLFSSNSARSLTLLEEISIEDCESMETIVFSIENTRVDYDHQDDEDTIQFTELRILTLTLLPRLVGFYYSNLKQPTTSSSLTRQEQLSCDEIVEEENTIPLFNEKVVFPRLEELTLWRIKVGKIWHDQLGAQGIFSFQNLTTLKVKDCQNLRYLCTSSMAKNLALLKKLEVVNCKSVEEIVATRGEMTGYQQLSFPKLNDLLLYGLPKLESFCGDTDLIEFPSLLNLCIEDCPHLSTFISNDPSVGPELSSSVLFNGKVAFPKLEELIIQSAGQFKMIWDDELHPNSFSELVTLKIEGGTNLLIVFPPSLSGSKSLNLQYLTIIDCDVLENVFDFGMPMKETEARSFENLKTVIASGCPALKSLFPECVALALQELEKLQIENCEKIEEIVSMDQKKDKQDQDCATRFVFPKVTSLSLCDLPQLERFYSGPHTSDWPCLDELTVLHCDKVDVFLPNTQRADASFAKIISNSKVSSFEAKDITVAYESLSGELIVNGLVSKAFPIALHPGFQNLQRLVVSSFPLKQLFPYGLLDDDSQAKILAQIQRLELIDLPEMTSIWSEHSQLNQILQNLQRLEVHGCDSLTTLAPSIALFQNLTHMDVWRCNGLTELIASFRAVRSLAQLVEIRVRECVSMTEIVANIIEDEDSNGDDDIVFSNLEKLTLESLTNLNSFCSARCNFKFTSLNSVIVTECPKMVFFSLGVLSTPKLTEVLVKKRCEDEEDHWDGDLNSTVFKVMVCSEKQLKFSEFPVLKNMRLDGELSLVHCRNLIFLEVDKCTFVSYAISFRLLLLLENLEELRITNCNSLEEVFDESKLALMNKNVGLLSRLKKFYLADLSSLKHVWPENFKVTSPFKNLSLLNICNCSSLRYVFTPSMALCVVNLQEIQVKNCASIEDIILNGEKSTSDNIPELKSLLLQSLPCLASFYSGNGILDCPKLEKITMIDCPEMETFASTSSIEEKDKSLGEGALPISLEALFNDKVKFPNLEEIRIVGMDGLKMVWQNELHPDSFSKLKTVNIEKGGALLRISPSGVPRKVLLNLENLTISKCVSLEVVFDIQMLMDGRETTHSTEPAATQLRTLGILSLPKLKHVWNKDPHGLFSFAKLDSVSVEECPTLTSLFPVSVAKGLQHLEKLEIKSCDGMTEIVSKKELDDHEESSVDLRFVFRKLTLFRLRRSPKLKEFYPGSHASRWPSLKSLIAYDRDNLGTIHPQFQRIQEDDAHNESQSVAGLFLSSFTKVIPNLEEVSLTSEDIDKICEQSSFVSNKLKVLDLISLQEFPIAFIQRFTGLEQLIVSCSSFEQLFPSYRETNANNLAKIAKLRLENLPKMMRIWNEESHQLEQILKYLEVWNCHRLITLTPSGTAFLTNLTYLDVWRCNGMTKLVTLSTAKSLALLREMRIRECDSLKEIAVSDGEEEGSDIVFGKLQSLTLQTLASLTTFCPVSCNFRFSSLYSVTVAECPRIEFFSMGHLVTPKLRSVWVNKEEEGRRGERWEGDLNSTVRQLFKEMVSIDID